MKDKYNETDLVQSINTNLDFVKNIAIEQADKCAGSIRSTLEYAVKLFWLKKYDEKPVWLKKSDKKSIWVKKYAEEFDLHNAIINEKFSKYFNEIVLGDMHIIRKTCNSVIHDGKPLSLEDAKELRVRLEKCVKAIELAIPMKIITKPFEKSTIINDIENTDTNEEAEESAAESAVEISVEESATEESANSEQEMFWEMLQEALDNNGNPFTIATRNQYGTVNKKSYNSNLCLGFDFLLKREFFRIGIYIRDDSSTHYFERLLSQKDEIENQLGFTPLWTAQGARNSNTRRIETHLSFIPYDSDDYERLIDEALPIFMRYLEVFEKYLPEAFENEQIDGGKQNMAVIIGNSLERDMTYGYGGSAQAIYDECCERFGWDRSQRYLFGPQKILYAAEATPEGYSPWFLTHNNYSESKGKQFNNTILQYTIEETWREVRPSLRSDWTLRVTFVKTKRYGYVFAGIYKPVNVEERILFDGKKVWVKTYKRIANIYPD